MVPCTCIMVLFFTESLVNIVLIYALYFEPSKPRIEFLHRYNYNIYIHVNILGYRYKAQLPIQVRRLPNLNNNIIFNYGSSMLELRRDDLQLFLVHYSFFVSVLYCYIWAILNLKSIPKMTPNLTPIMTPNSTPKRLQIPLHVLQHANIVIRSSSLTR